MLNIGSYMTDNLVDYALDVGMDREFFGTTEVTAVNPSDGVEYEQAARAVFHFLRHNDDRRYSSRTKMRVLEAAQTAEDYRIIDGRAVPEHLGLPSFLLARKPFSYDEETEVKQGGLIGALVAFPDGKALVTVNTRCRRKRWGSYLISLGQMIGSPLLTLWVHRRNTGAQQFLLRVGGTPEAMNAAGGVAYRLGTLRVEDGQEDREDSPF